MKRFLVCLSVIGIVITSCSKSNELTESGNSNTGGTGCDTVNIKYTTDVKTIIQANCYSCHGNGQAQGGVNLDTYSSVKQHADNGSLIGVITHAAGYPPMPQGAAKLSDCDINKIKAWIARGTLNN